MFNGNGATVSEKLGVDSEVRELKFGSSFNPGNKGQQGAFHTIRYDFKPASVDRSKMATMEVGPSGQVTISMPHYDTGTTVFKGPTRPYTKECVLIIDKDTGEFVLEKLNHNVQVKKTRQERPEGATRSSSKTSAPPIAAEIRPSSLIIQSDPNIQKSPPKEEKIKRPNSSNSSSSQQPAHSLNSSSVRVNRQPNSPMTTNGPARHSPVGLPPGPNSPLYNSHGGQGIATASNPFDSNSKQQHHQSQSFMPSLTSIEDLLITPPIHAPPTMTTKVPVPKTTSSSSNVIKNTKESLHESVNALSESSSSSGSSSSSEDDDDDSSSISDMEEVMPDKVPIPPVVGREKPLTPPVTMTMSMPSFLSLGNSTSTKPTPPTMSMPSHLLSEDLQLSESGSDSD